MKKKLFVILMSIMMVITMMPAMAFAEEDGIKTADAFADAIAQGGEIKLMDSFEVTKTPSGTAVYAISKNTTIDLNGKTLTINVPTTNNSTLFFNVSAGTFTVKDSSVNKDGKLIVDNTGTGTKGGGYFVKTTGGSFSLESGNIEIKKTGSKALNGIWAASGASTTISGGSIKYEGGGTLSPFYDGGAGFVVSGGEFNFAPPFTTMASGKVTYLIAEGEHAGWYGVTDGTYVGAVDGTPYTSFTDFAKAIDGDTGKISVVGNKFTLTDTIEYTTTAEDAKIIFLTDITLDLKGYSLKSNVKGASAYLLYVDNKDATLTITDSSEGKTGKVEGNINYNSWCYPIGVNKGTLVVDGATIASDATTTSGATVLTAKTSDATIRLNNAKITVDNDSKGSANGIELKDGSKLFMDGTEIDVTGTKGNGIVSGTGVAVNIGQASGAKSTINFTYSTSAANGSVYGIADKGTIKIKNCDITITDGTVTGSYKPTKYGIKVSEKAGSLSILDDVKISISGNNIADVAYGIYSGSVACNISGKDVEININCPNVANCNAFYTEYTTAGDITIDPADDADVKVSVVGSESGTHYISNKKNTATGKTIIKGGTFTGGGFMDGSATITGGVFDRDPGENAIDAGYIAKENTPTEGKWTVAVDDTPRVRNLTQGENYINLTKASEAAHDHDELQLLTDVNANSDMKLTSVNLDLNGYDVTLSKLYTEGDVTITDKQATSYDKAGTLNARIIVGAGETTLTGINHEYTSNSSTGYPFQTESANDATPAMLTIKGVKGVYGSVENSTQSRYVVFAKANSRVVIDNAAGYETNLTLNTDSQTPELVYGDSNNCSTIINDGEFSIICNNANYGNCFVFNADATALINGGKFKLISTYDFKSKIVNNVSNTVNVQGGYYVATANEQEVSQNDFFGNATTLGSNGKSAVILATIDPMYEAGYRYTVKAEAVATVNEQPYTSLTDAIYAAGDTDTVKLLADVSLTEYSLSKNVNFDANGHTVKLNGNKPLVLAAGVDLPECFDVSDAIGYIENNSGEKAYYKYWGDSSVTGVITEYDSNSSKQIVLTKDMNRTSSLMVNKTCTIDLNGFSIIGNNCQYETFEVYNNAVVTVKDSSENKTGKITGNNDKYYTVLISGNGCSFILESGTIENSTTNGAAISTLGQYSSCDDVTITINGGKVIAEKGFSIVDNGQYSKNVTININGGEVNSNGGVAIYHPASGKITLSGGTIIGNTGIYIRSGELVVPEDSTVKVIGNGEYGEHDPDISGAAELTGDAIAICESNYPGGKVSADIAGGKFYSKNAYAVASYATTGQTALTGFLKGGIYGADSEAIDISNKNLIAAGYQDIPNPDTATKDDHPWMIGVAKTYVAQIGDNKYETLAEAIAAVPAGGSTPTEITMLCDVTDAVGISVPSNKNFIVDFAGYTYTVNKPGAGSTGTTTQAFQLNKNSTVVFKNGTINVAEDNLTLATVGKNIKRLIQNYADLTLENMILDGTNLYVNDSNTDRAVVETANGNVNITGNTSITGKADGNVRALNVDTWKGAYNSGSKVAINTTGTVDEIYLYSEGTAILYTKSSLVITGGKFVSVTGDTSNDYTSAISGGYFKEAVDSKYIAPGYECVENPDFDVIGKDTKDYQYKVQSKVVIPVDDDPDSGNIEVQIDTETEQKAATVDETKVTGVTEKEVATEIIGKINGSGSGENKSDIVDLTETVGNFLSKINLDEVKEIAKETDTKHSTTKETDLDTLLANAKEAAKTQDVEVTMNVTTDVDVKVVGVTVEENSKEKVTRFALDITPYYTLTVTSKVDGEQADEVKIVTEEMKEELEVPETTVVTFPAPAGFVYTEGMSLFVIHTKESGDKFTYPAAYDSETNTISFTNPNGFSEFAVVTTTAANPIAQNVQTEEFYTDLGLALKEAEESGENQTVILLKDLTAANALNQNVVEVAPNVTLDLNGYDLEARLVVAFGLIKNNRGAADGKLIVAQNNFAYMGGKEMNTSDENVLPVWDTNGYVFCAVNTITSYWNPTLSAGTNPKYQFRPESADISKILAADSGVKVIVEIEYKRTGKDYYDNMTVEFGQQYITSFLGNYNDNWGMYVTLLGTDNITEIKARANLKSDKSNFSIVSDWKLTSENK